MNAGTDTRTANSPDSAGGQRRRVRLFVALHVGAVLGLYALAVGLGGGLAMPPLPPQALATAPALAKARAPVHGAAAPDVAATPGALPAWTQRAEIAAPWDTVSADPPRDPR